MGEKICVGLFDSGVGGLTVLDACRRACPSVQFLYYGDNGNAPYGERGEEEIYALVRHGVEALVAAGAETVILACNTATAVCAELLRAEFSVPIVGMEPAVKTAAKSCRNLLLLATERTAVSARISALVARFPQVRIEVRGTRLAGAVERWLIRGEEISLETYLPRGKYDGVVLGCTHYHFLKKEIGAFYDAPVFDGTDGTVRRLAALLSKRHADFVREAKCAPKPVFLGEWGGINEEIYAKTLKNGQIGEKRVSNGQKG